MVTNQSRNYYTLLGVEPQSPIEDVIAAYDRRRHHEPVDPGEQADLDAAYKVLSDPGRRAAYDRELGLESAGRRGFGGRELVYGALGMLIGLLVLSGVWLFSERRSNDMPTVTEVTPYSAPTFNLKDLNGNSVDLEAYRGKVVLLNFWATYCEPCKEETPALEAVHRKLQDQGLAIIGIDLLASERSQNRDLDDVRSFATQYGVTYPLALDDTGDVAASYAISPIPTSYIIDRQGQVRYVKIGALSMADVEQLFRRLESEGG